ncbi:coiled-coil alpha-helical rod protein 1 [Lates japonicus]|uniref:Coiled-coil alpha-helical rod protein 1 n=1 Tax=Lates japonicus TaxID=270547 RepID=A0AAD3NFC1_LATJO|nr:coiled-coil alpha-helical rod protein 1 [Lates japonicus]
MLFLSSFQWMTSYDLNLFQATVAERGLVSEYTRVHTAAPQNSAAPKEQRQKPSERCRSVGAKAQLPADERLLSVLEELHSLSAAVVNSSEDSAEEEGQNDSVGPSTGSLHS